VGKGTVFFFEFLNPKRLNLLVEIHIWNF